MPRRLVLRSFNVEGSSIERRGVVFRLSCPVECCLATPSKMEFDRGVVKNVDATPSFHTLHSSHLAGPNQLLEFQM